MELSIKQLSTLGHTLGVRIYEAVMLDESKYKILPPEFYRNYYYVSEDSSSFSQIKDLIDLKLMVKIGPEYFKVTELGKSIFINQFCSLAIYRPKINRDEHYLRHKINFYCSWANYKFGNDNASHIISAYQNYYAKGQRVSHTTEDTINKFKRDLKRLFGTKKAI